VKPRLALKTLTGDVVRLIRNTPVAFSAPVLSLMERKIRLSLMAQDRTTTRKRLLQELSKKPGTPTSARELKIALGLSDRQLKSALAKLGDDVVWTDDGYYLNPTNEEPSIETRNLEITNVRGKTPRGVKEIAEAKADKASVRSDVTAVREEILSGQLLDWDELPQWIEDQSRIGTRMEEITLGPKSTAIPGRRMIDGFPVIRVETREIRYAGPGDAAARSIGSTVELEPLRRLSESLASDYGWHPAQATAFILCGVVPVAGPRVRTTRRISGGTEVVSVSIEGLDPRDDAKAVSAIFTKVKESLGIRSRRLSDDDALRYQTLRKFSAEHGRGAEGWSRWRDHLKSNGLPESWNYSDRRAYWTACKRADRASLGQQTQAKAPASSRAR